MYAYCLLVLTLRSTVFRNDIFAHFYALNNNLAINSLSAISSLLVLTCDAKCLKIDREIKLKCPKLDFSRDFQWARRWSEFLKLCTQSYQPYSDFKATNKFPVPLIVTLTRSCKNEPN